MSPRDSDIARNRMSPLTRIGRRTITSLIFSLLFVCTVARGQTPTPTPNPSASATPEVVTGNGIRVKTDLVTLTLTVTDPFNRYVSGLTKKAFTVTDNGLEQEIIYFSDTDAPVSLGIIF